MSVCGQTHYSSGPVPIATDNDKLFTITGDLTEAEQLLYTIKETMRFRFNVFQYLMLSEIMFVLNLILNFKFKKKTQQISWNNQNLMCESTITDSCASPPNCASPSLDSLFSSTPT